MLTRKQEDYLETIAEIAQEKGYSRVKEIAARLDVRAASVTSMVKSLARKEMVSYEKNAPITLTDAGRKVAALVISKHLTFTSFFELIGVPSHIAKNDSMKIEHNLSPVTIKKLKEFIEAYQKRG